MPFGCFGFECHCVSSCVLHHVVGLETDVLAESGQMHNDASLLSVGKLYLRSAGAALGILGMEEIVNFLGNLGKNL